MFDMEFVVVAIPVVPVLAALVLELLDVVIGFAAAVKNKCVSSTKMRDGLWHKLGFAAAIVVAALMEEVVANVALGVDVPTTMAVCVFVIVAELVSILENLCQLTPELERVFGKVLELKDKEAGE